MSIWDEHDVENKIVEILDDVRLVNDYHHFGRPYMTAYQLAIKMNERHPEVAQALEVGVGGAGTGRRTSLAQYLARELSRRIRDNPAGYPVQGAFMSNEAVRQLVYSTPHGGEVTSSATYNGYDLSLYRLRSNP